MHKGERARLATGDDAASAVAEIDYSPVQTSAGVDCTRICFSLTDGSRWIGSFKNGGDPLCMLEMIDDEWCLVVAQGSGYLVTPESPRRWSTVPVDPVRSVVHLPEQHILVLADHTDIAVLRVPTLLWTRRVTWDELKIDKVTNSLIYYSGWSPTRGSSSHVVGLLKGEPLSGEFEVPPP